MGVRTDVVEDEDDDEEGSVLDAPWGLESEPAGLRSCSTSDDSPTRVEALPVSEYDARLCFE
jgi:hypothetical protein